MNTSIQNVSVSHKSSITKIAEGALLIAVAALAVNGIISFTAPSYIWKGEIPMFTPDLFDHPYEAPTAEDIVSGMETLDRVSMAAAVLVALYPVYHAIWCLCAGAGCNCKAPVFCGRMSRRFGSLSACSLLAVLAVCRGFECYIDGGVTGDKRPHDRGPFPHGDIDCACFLDASWRALSNGMSSKVLGAIVATKPLSHGSAARMPCWTAQAQTWCCCMVPRCLPARHR